MPSDRAMRKAREWLVATTGLDISLMKESRIADSIAALLDSFAADAVRDALVKADAWQREAAAMRARKGGA